MNKLEDLNPLFCPSSIGGQDNAPLDERMPTMTNYYKFALVGKINAYFYQIQESPVKRDTENPEKPKEEQMSPLKMLQNYESTVRSQLAEDYRISDILTYGAKKEICIFRMETTLNKHDQDLGFNQLKDAIDNLINEHKLSMKLVSASSFDANSVFKPQPAHHHGARPVSIVYLSFLRALKKYLCQKLTISRPDVEILPFANQLLVKSSEDAFRILKINASLSIRNEIITNMTVCGIPQFYRLSTLLDGEFDILKNNYVLYICPSGVRCSFANMNMLANSISFEPPSNYENMLSLLAGNSNIQLTTPSRWIKLVPNLNHMNGLTPKIAKYLESAAPNSKYIMWPAELCMIQFADAEIEPQVDIEDSFNLIEELMQESEEVPDVKMEQIEEEPETHTDVEMDQVKESPGNWDDLFGDESADDEVEESPPSEETKERIEFESSPVNQTQDFIEQSSTNPFYEDPGAPSPVSFQIFASPSPQTTDMSSTTEEPHIGTPKGTPKDLKKSIFAPLNFNPLIEKDIDSKYSNGGKFFVKNDSQSARSQESASTTPTFWKNKKAESDFEDQDLISDSEEDVEEEEEDQEEDQTGLGISIQSIAKNTGILSSITAFAPPLASQPTAPVVSQEIQNWLFWILRGPPICTIPPRFLTQGNPHISKDRIDQVLPILQELTLYSSDSDNMFREKPGEVPETLEKVILDVFPGSSKVRLYELLDCVRTTPEVKLFDSLFGNTQEVIKLEVPRFDFDDPSFATTSPLMNVVETENKRHSGVFRDNTNSAILDSVQRNSLFRIPTTLLNTKRNNNQMKINETSLDYWKLLDLQPFKEPINTRVVFIIPKSTPFLREKSRLFLSDLASTYQSCNLGSMKQLQDLLEIDADNDELFLQTVKDRLGDLASSLKNQYLVDYESQKDPVLVLIGVTSTSMQFTANLADVLEQFQSSLTQKTIDFEMDEDARKRRKKNESDASTIPIPIRSFYKLIPLQDYFPSNGSFAVISCKKMIETALQLYELCPGNEKFQPFKNRARVMSISRELPQKIPFVMTKNPVSSGLIVDDLYLHVCYERSIDKHWCVASWTDQYGEINFVRSWYIAPESKWHNFEEVSDEILSTTLEYVAHHPGKTYVILTRLNNIIPDDELTEWKRLSIKNGKLVLIVLAVELEPSTLILSHIQKQKDEIKDMYSVKFTAGSTTSQMMTPNVANRIESPMAGQTPSFDPAASPMDTTGISSSQQPLMENPELVELSNECYGLIFQVAQQLSNQSIRMPLRTGFLVNSGIRTSEGYPTGAIIELNLLSCQAGVVSIDLLKKLICQYKHLGVLNRNGICPWHVHAVRKMLDYLVHVQIE